MTFVGPGVEGFEGLTDLFVFGLIGPGDNSSGSRVAKKLDARQQFLKHLQRCRGTGFA